MKQRSTNEVKLKIADFSPTPLIVVTTRFVSNLRLPEMIADKSVTTPAALVLPNGKTGLPRRDFINASNDTVFNILKLFDYKKSPH